MLDESIYHFRGAGSILSVSVILFFMEIRFVNKVGPDHTPRYVGSYLVRHCLFMTLVQFLGDNELIVEPFKKDYVVQFS